MLSISPLMHLLFSSSSNSVLRLFVYTVCLCVRMHVCAWFPGCMPACLSACQSQRDDWSWQHLHLITRLLISLQKPNGTGDARKRARRWKRECMQCGCRLNDKTVWLTTSVCCCHCAYSISSCFLCVSISWGRKALLFRSSTTQIQLTPSFA